MLCRSRLTAHCTALTKNALALQMPRPLKKTLMPSAVYASFAILNALGLTNEDCLPLTGSCSLLNSGCVALSILLAWQRAMTSQVCTRVLTISSSSTISRGQYLKLERRIPNGKMLAHVITPANPPHSMILAACWFSLSASLVMERLLSS